MEKIKMKTIRWGIIGCGDVTEVKSGPGFQNSKNSQLVAVMRRNGASAARTTWVMDEILKNYRIGKR